MTMNWPGRRDAGSGVHITGSGNQVNTGRVGGDQRQVQVTGGDAEAGRQRAVVQARLAELAAALDEHESELSNPSLARRTTARINEELTGTEPDRRRLTENLEDLNLAVGSVASVVTVVQALATAVAALHG
ncbi:hypothetical protein ACFTT0_03850 [Streptomyces bauhiniae]|uniref:hypothetical protein n=1 Tax=Streptomyces bauhiniae TaxID=2340725 RepID=UPI0033A593F3